MKKMKYIVFALILTMALVLSACQPAATPEPAPVEEPMEPVEEPMEEPEPTDVPEPVEEPTEEPEVMIGTVDNPIKVLFVPSTDANVIVTGGEVMAEALKEATGLEFEVVVPTSYAATAEEMCASPENSMGFIPATLYTIANQLCGVDVSFKAVRRGFSVYWAQILVGRDSGIETLEDLNGKSWGFPDGASTSGFTVPSAWFAEQGIVPGEQVETGGHNQAVSAVYQGEVDFATSFYSPPAKPEGEEPWEIGDAPDIPEDLIDECVVDDDGLVCGGWLVLDARANIRTEAPDVVEKVKILALTPEIPNDTLSFSPDFPADVRVLIEEALLAFAETERWNESIGSPDFYSWSGLDPAIDAEYDVIRLITAGKTLDDFR